LRNSRSPIEQRCPEEFEAVESNLDASSSEYGESRRPFQPKERSHLHFKVNILEFEGQLDRDHFFNWLQTIERIFDYKDIPEDEKVKLITLRL